MKKVSVILLIVGILLGVSPVIGQLYTRYQENRMMEEWLNSVDADAFEVSGYVDPEEAYSQLQQAFAAEGSEGAAGNAGGSSGYGVGSGEGGAGELGTSGGLGSTGGADGDGGDGSADASSSGGTGADGSAKKTSGQTVLGIIQIKKIKVKAPVVEGVRESNLRAGVGHIPGTASLGQPGNCALAGHRSYTFGKFFNRLDELALGDEVIITTKKEDLKYKVSKITVVTPDDMSVLRGGKDENVITLITCTPIYIASHRLIVTAELEERVLKEP